ncbi:diphosphomevalonate decarboxylase [Thalassobius sp. Cn5-15]|uniref:diphosphomevalonate decarboxylase n=1 Tax=Thalassobius sp. Cn5-15 TaxID=2917763 RepID=UPI001EF2FD8E|nr:diphosphomevalonate decarboxylase [Thalassobius sp. Cn5-15]MCG7494393.1 diphosphomevalonate decarboxylase [Thalassobius sp. Cn5-15]
MNDAAKQLIRDAMAKASASQTASAYAPSNIALSKYWGKRDRARNLPLNSSLSISLAEWGSHTQVVPSKDGRDRVTLGGEDLSLDTPFAAKALKFADLFRGEDGSAKTPLWIETSNTIPTAAGLASSASGFAALTQALCGAFGLSDHLSEAQMSLIARLGSGSATRSLWHGFVRWDKGTQEDGSDSFAQPLNLQWPEFRIAILPVDVGPKSHSSRDGMNHTVATSPLFASWPDQAEADCQAIETAVRAQDFDTLGALAEANALAMHATMQAARPALSYLTTESWALLDQLWQARKEGLQAYATMDAGANVKLIFLGRSTDDITHLFPQAQVIEPFKTL